MLLDTISGTARSIWVVVGPKVGIVLAALELVSGAGFTLSSWVISSISSELFIVEKLHQSSITLAE